MEDVTGLLMEAAIGWGNKLWIGDGGLFVSSYYKSRIVYKASVQNIVGGWLSICS